MNRKAIALATATLTGALSVFAFGYEATADQAKFEAKLQDPRGRLVGTVKFRIDDDVMHVDAKLRRNRYVKAEQFHGFHLHANSDDTNGVGCVADPKQEGPTWFVSADDHLSQTGQTHGDHSGDLPSPLVMADGTARLRFDTDRIDPAVIRGRAVILHANPDNFGNVPVGTAGNQYTPNSSAATDLTARTGNASNRVACGLIKRDR